MAEDYVGRKFKTSFAGKKVLDSPLAWQLIAASRKLAPAGLLKGVPGNLSVRSEKGFVITAGGVDKENLAVTDLAEVLDYDSEKNVVTVSGLKEPSSEARMHWHIYKNFPDVKAVVHVHDALVLENEDKAKRLGVVFTEKEASYGTEELAEQVLKALKRDNYVVMVNHGSIAVGKTLKGAVDLVLSVHSRML